MAELTELLHLTGWTSGLRVFVRKERSNPGAVLRMTHHEGMWITAFATDITQGQLPVFRHRCRVRCKDQTRNTKVMGLLRFPFQAFALSQLIQLAGDLGCVSQVCGGPRCDGGWMTRRSVLSDAQLETIRPLL